MENKIGFVTRLKVKNPLPGPIMIDVDALSEDGYKYLVQENEVEFVISVTATNIQECLELFKQWMHDGIHCAK